MIIWVSNLRPKRIDGDLLPQILRVRRSPNSSLLDYVVPNTSSSWKDVRG